MAMMAANYLLVPVETEYKSIKGVNDLLNTMDQVRQWNPTLQVAGFVPTKHDGRRTHSRWVMQNIEERISAQGQMLETIPRATVFADASMYHQPIHLQDPNHKAVQVFETLATQFIESIGLVAQVKTATRAVRKP